MPTSMEEGKDWVQAEVAKLRPRRILDIGPGEGTYRALLGSTEYSQHWTAVEIWGPYVAAYDLESKYDQVVVADARYLDWEKLGWFDLVILGDMFDHISKSQAVELYTYAQRNSSSVLVAAPISFYWQGETYGNPHEAHVATWSEKQMLAALPGVTSSWTGEVEGYFLSTTPAMTNVPDEELAKTLRLPWKPGDSQNTLDAYVNNNDLYSLIVQQYLNPKSRFTTGYTVEELRTILNAGWDHNWDLVVTFPGGSETPGIRVRRVEVTLRLEDLVELLNLIGDDASVDTWTPVIPGHVVVLLTWS